MENNSNLIKAIIALFTAASINCATIHKVPNSDYVTIGNAEEILKQAIEENLGIKPTFEEACFLADRDPDKIIIPEEARGYLNAVRYNH